MVLARFAGRVATGARCDGEGIEMTETDPNAALTRMRELIVELAAELPGPDVLRTSGLEDVAAEVVAEFEGLDEWLSKGGFAPDAWGP
jgi:hypothetical protein